VNLFEVEVIYLKKNLVTTSMALNHLYPSIP
jgi:hypothetical protein